MKKILATVLKELPGGFVSAVWFLAKHLWGAFCFVWAVIITLLVGAELQRQGRPGHILDEQDLRRLLRRVRRWARVSRRHAASRADAARPR